MNVGPLKNGRGLALILVAIAVAMFASGALVTRAAWSGDSPSTVLNVNPSAWTGAPQAGAPAAGRDDAKVTTGAPGLTTEEDAGRLMSPLYWSNCPAPLPTVLAGSTINPALAGFDLRLLGAGFSLQNFAIRSEGPCDDDGRTASGSLIVDMGWIHGETGLDVWVSQRVVDEPAANVRQPESATVYDGGYVFTVYVNSYRVLPYEKPLPADLPAAEAGIAPPYGGPDPRAAGVLDSVLAQLVPQVRADCYYRQADGAWDDLSKLGAGDPRPAIPAGYSETQFNLVTFAPPAADCSGASLSNPLGAGSFNATFSTGAGDSIGVSAYAMPEGSENYAGYMDDWSASWTRDGISFGIWGSKAQAGIGSETLLAIATAMDPAFSPACMAQSIELTEADLIARGVRVPQPSEGYTQTSFTGRETGVDKDCATPDSDAREEYSGQWTFESADGYIEASVSKYPEATSTRGGGISDFGLKWADGKGGFYYVQGQSRGISPAVDRDVLIAVAKSMDPELDVDALEDGGASGGGSSDSSGGPVPPDQTR